MTKPARLQKVNEPKPLRLYINPVTILLAGLVIILIISALVFAMNGGSAVESGGMRNFLVNGV